jgi:hypothetical protein
MQRPGNISLSGAWDFRFDDEREWRAIPVPGCWEMLEGVAKDRPGPAWYRKRIEVPRDFVGWRVWLRFDAVSYHCTVSVNGKDVGSHTGLWDGFDLEITDAVRAGDAAEILVKVEKPASLTEGPSSKPVPGNFPLKQTLSGFLPYVWGHMFGGIWQDVSLYSTGDAFIRHFWVRGDQNGHCFAQIELSKSPRLRLTIRDPDRAVVFDAPMNGGTVEFTIPNPRRWSPRDPMLYEAKLVLDGESDARTARFGLRTQSIADDHTTLLLNGAPIYPRMILSWGWDPNSLNSNPGPERVRADFNRLKSLGYNGVKLCLWFPPQYYFDLADEMGMLLWVELPMWLPEVNDFFRKQTPPEYARLSALAAAHPSVILYTLGCELNAQVGADVLHRLFKIVKQNAGDALVRDNSGGGDAYGGLLNEFAEFYDYHFYSDLQFFRPLLDSFTPRGKPPQPWVFGEFCDLDTFRDLRHLYIANHDVKPWWTVRNEKINPQGARWQFDIVDWEDRLKKNGCWERGEALEKLSRRYALLHRKHTLETVRFYREVGGYVVTGEADTPISTAGMWDDLGQLKFDADEFRAFNDDTVLLLHFDARRTWINGGDRAAPQDTWCYPAGATVRAHLIVSHYGPEKGPATLTWQVSCGDAPHATGDAKIADLTPGSIRELTVVEFAAPKTDSPIRLTLTATVRIGQHQATNRWPIYIFPSEPWKEVRNVALVDPLIRMNGVTDMCKSITRTIDGSTKLVIATSWTDALDRFVSRGGHAILLQLHDAPRGPVPTVAMPFWRESIRLIETRHRAWQDFPLDDGIAGLQFFGCATDCALDTDKLDRPHHPILRRLDARTVAVHDYATEIEWNDGRLIVSTLRFEGSQGLANSTQPLGIARNIAASYLLRCWAKYLQDR